MVKGREIGGLGAASSSTRGAGRAPRGPASSCKGRAVQSRQARPEEAQETSWGAAQGALCPCGEDRGGEKDEDVVAEVVQADGGVGGGDERGGGVGHVRRRVGGGANQRGGSGYIQQAGAARSSWRESRVKQAGAAQARQRELGEHRGGGGAPRRALADALGGAASPRAPEAGHAATSAFSRSAFLCLSSQREPSHPKAALRVSR